MKRSVEFANLLKEIVASSGEPAYEIAGRIPMTPTHLSRLMSGKLRSVNVETLSNIIATVTKDPAARAALLQAYFRDQVLPEMRRWITVLPPNGRVAEQPVAKSDDPVEQFIDLIRQRMLPTEVLRSFHKLAELAPENAELQALVIDAAAFAHSVIHDDAASNNAEPAPKRRSVSYSGGEETSAARTTDEPARGVEAAVLSRKELDRAAKLAREVNKGRKKEAARSRSRKRAA